MGACTDRLLSPCHHPPVSLLLPRICLVGRTMASTQLQAAPTHKRTRLGRRLYLAKGTTAHLSVPYPTPCTPPLHSCGPGDVLHVQTAELWKSPLALSHMKRRGSLGRLFLPKVKHYLRAAPTLKIYIRRIEEAFCLRDGGSYFSDKNVFEKSNC